VLGGLVGGVGQLFLTEAIRVAPVGVVAPFDYSQLIWATALGFLVWGELPHPATLAGAAVVAASGIYILHRELRRFRRAALAA
jgi:drug/metabolite transporter (DMT)-like permease